MMSSWCLRLHRLWPYNGDIFEGANMGLYKNGVALTAAQREAHGAYMAACDDAIQAAVDFSDTLVIKRFGYDTRKAGVDD